jgi:uncharacterized protein (DUF2141 family)
MKRHLTRPWIRHLVPPVLALLAPVVWAGDLELSVENVRSQEGEVRIGLYATPDDYRKTPMREAKAAANGNPVSIRIPGLPAGEYAIALYHDRNSNQKLDSNVLGIPIEPYGFSVAPGRSLSGPAGWEQAKFNLPPDGASISIRLSD